MNFKLKNTSTGVRKRNRGAISLEYILIIVVVVLACLVGMKVFGGRIGNTINDSKDAVVNTTDNVFNRLGGTATGGGSGSDGSGSTGGVEADGSVIINEVNFPDAAFRTYVATKFDTDSDGKLASDERSVVTFMNVNNQGITTLQGIEYFTELRTLYCQSNQLTTLDLSNNTALIRLDCAANKLTSLDVSNNIALSELECGENQLTALDISNNTSLTKLTCYQNQLTTLDVSNNTALTKLYCDKNQLTTLDLTHNPSLNSSNVYVDGNVSVTYYNESGSAADGSVLINEANFPDATFRTYVATNFDTDSDGKLASDERNAVTDIYVYNQGITTLKGVEYFTSLTYLDCDSNQLTSLDVSNNTALIKLICSQNQLKTLDVSNNTALEGLICEHNQLTTLDLTNNPRLDEYSVQVDDTVNVTYAS